MSYSKVTQLRKNGNLSEAYTMASNDLKEAHEDIWAKKAMAWCIYDFLKKYSQIEYKDKFINKLIELKKLEMPDSETMIYDNLVWPLFYIIRDCHDRNWVDNNFFDNIFDNIRSYNFTRPSKNYSVLFKVFLFIKNDWIKFKEFCDWWNFDNFRPEDYKKEKMKNGKEIMSLVERAYIAYSKVLLQGFKKNIYLENDIEEFLSKLSNIIESHSEYTYTIYYKAKLLLLIGQNNNVVNLLRPFVMFKQNEFWVWELLGDALDNDEKKFSCYCKALTCSALPEMLVGLRERFVDMLISREMYDEAKTEINIIISIKIKNHWKISLHIENIQQSDWYLSAILKRNNQEIYNRNKNLAESLLYENMPTKLILITYVNINKKMASFITTDRQQGFFSYKNTKYFPHVPQINDVFSCRIENIEQHKPTVIVTTEIIDKKEPNNEFFRSFSGILKLNPNGFGFVDDIERIFVPLNLTKQIEDNSIVSGRAVVNFDRKRNQWGWKAISIK